MRPRSAALACAALACAVVSSTMARTAPVEASQGGGTFSWLPGAAREIPRTDSASRDAAVFEYAYGPAAQSTLAGEWAWFAVHVAGLSLRLGTYGMVGMENVDALAPFPPGGQLWRGMAGMSFALSLDSVAARIGGENGGLELALVLGHESGHGDLGEPPDERDIPVWRGMQFLEPDVAVRIGIARALQLKLRVGCRLFVHGPMVAAPSASVVLRWSPLPWLVPQVAAFGEGLLSKPAFRDGYCFRALVGIGFAGKVGEVVLYGAIEVGNGRGMLVNTQEVRWTAGLRYAPFGN